MKRRLTKEKMEKLTGTRTEQAWMAYSLLLLLLLLLMMMMTTTQFYSCELLC